MESTEQITPETWVASVLAEGEQTVRALAALPGGGWGAQLQEAVRTQTIPNTSMKEIILDPSGNRECPRALREGWFREELLENTVFGFAYDWAGARLPVWAGGPVASGTYPDLASEWDDALDIVIRCLVTAFEEAVDESAARVLVEAATPGAFVLPAPSPQPYGVSHEGAERLVADWMKHLGAGDAEVTPFGADGGIDVRSSRYVAQVKNYEGNVGVEPIRELAGVAAVEQLTALFFASRGYAPGAAAFADRAGVALFVYDTVAGTLVGFNSTGIRLRDIGLG